MSYCVTQQYKNSMFPVIVTRCILASLTSTVDGSGEGWLLISKAMIIGSFTVSASSTPHLEITHIQMPRAIK